MAYATIQPEEAARQVDEVMNTSSVQTWALIGLVLFTSYWLLWAWLRPAAETHGAENCPLPKVTQNHSGSGHNIYGETINIGAPKFVLDEGVMSEIASHLTKSKRVDLWMVGECFSDDTLRDYLTNKGFMIGELNRIAQLGMVPPHKRPVDIQIQGDRQKVIVDPK